MTRIVRAKRKKKAPLHFVATCGAGLDELVAGEVREQGGNNIVTRLGAVSWTGSLESGYRMCLWSRCASRVLLQIACFTAADTDALYREAGKIDWAEHFSGRDTFAVFATIRDSPITHSRFAALRVKDAIADQFRSRTGNRPSVDTDNPAIRINLHLDKTEAVLALDLSGESLHRRGYRVAAVEAPLKETLAAGIVLLSGFSREFPSQSMLFDPMCGCGTLLIEAAMIYGDVAPGLLRKTFGFEAWNKHDSRLWDRLVTAAVQREEEGMNRPWPQIAGADADPGAVHASRTNITAAALEERIVVRQGQLAFLKSPQQQGMVLTNPPYGERLAEREEVKHLYRCLGRIISQELPGWQVGFFAANPDFCDSLNIQWEEQHRLFNGPIKCRLYNGVAGESRDFLPRLPIPHPPEPEMEGLDLANRLRKNYTALRKWADSEGISCFRIYDADLQEYNFAVDLYGRWVHVQEYAAPPSIDAKKASQRFQEGLQAIRQVLGIPPSRLFIKTRKVQKGKKQYQKEAHRGKLHEVREGPCRFLVNFTDYLDTGLFLDHRITRTRVGALAAGKTFLNLFGYTGSATVHAMMQGALSTTTVDASATYLQRARANFALNGFGGPQHLTVQQDCLKWLAGCRERFGLIFVDPPTFSNDRHRKTTFSVQDDHERLLTLCMRCLSRDGIVLFSTNFRKFKLAETLLQRFAVTEITDETIPRDFAGRPSIHRCWEIRHLEESVDEEKEHD